MILENNHRISEEEYPNFEEVQILFLRFFLQINVQHKLNQMKISYIWIFSVQFINLVVNFQKSALCFSADSVRPSHESLQDQEQN